VKKKGTDWVESAIKTSKTKFMTILTTSTSVILRFDLINNDFKGRNLLMFNSLLERF
jgi:hypothetical protein